MKRADSSPAAAGQTEKSRNLAGGGRIWPGWIQPLDGLVAEAGGRDQAPFAEGVATPVAVGRDKLLRRTLAGVDALAAVLALLAATISFGEESLDPLAVVAVGPLIVLASKVIGLYDEDEYRVRKSTLEDVPRVFCISTFYALAFWFGAHAIVDGPLYRAQVLVLALAAFLLMILGRAATRVLARTFAPTETCIVVGSRAAAERVASKFAQAHSVKAHVIGCISLGGREAPMAIEHELPLLGELETLPAVVAQRRVERVIVAPHGSEHEAVLSAIRRVKALGVKVSVVPQLLEAVGSSSVVDEVDGMTLLGVRRYGLTRSSELLKRCLDAAVATTCIVLLVPLLALLALAIKLDSPGPVLFRQRRIGRDGEEFEILKYRSMVAGAELVKHDLVRLNQAGALFKITNDPRITRFGRWLRRTSLDELPQLFNVLVGHMSLVGPRPLIPEEDAKIEGWERRRLVVRPGMTGLWQVYGSSRIPMEEMVKIDYLYAANWSLWLDMKVLARTVSYVCAGRGM